MCVGQDVTKVLALQRYTESLFEQTVAPMCVVKCDDGKIILWNNAMAEVTQVAETEAIGKDFVADFLTHSARSGTEARHRRAGPARRRLQVHGPGRRRRGRPAQGG